jgi:hypothetical protein
MPEGVVVALEAVQVEDDQHARLRALAVAKRPVEIVDEAAAVAELGERVGDGLLADLLQDQPVLAERQPRSHHDDEQRGRGEDERQGIEPVEVVVDQHADGGQARQRSGREPGPGGDRLAPRWRGRLPRGPGDEKQRRRPKGVERCPGHVLAHRLLEEKDGIRDGRAGQPGADEEPEAPRPPAGEGEHADDERQKEHVADRVGEVRHDRRRRALGVGEDELHQHRCADGRGGEGGRDAVQPETPVEVGDVPPDEQQQPYVEEREEGEVEGVRCRRERRVVGVREREE